MNSISLASSIAMAVGLAASLPQIARMIRARSAAGQSLVGWSMGLVANCAMGYVNLFGFHAHLLALSNTISASLCVAAMALITRFGTASGATQLAAAQAAKAARAARIEGADGARRRDGASYAAPSQHTLADLPTMELVALRSALDQADALRADRRERDLAPA